MCNVCELVHLWLLRISNECHSLHMFLVFLVSSHDVTTASPPSPHFHLLPVPPPPPLPPPAHCCCLGLKPPKKRLDYNPDISARQRIEVISHS